MKKIYTTPARIALGTLFYMCVSLSANAQRPVRTDGGAAQPSTQTAQPAATVTPPHVEVAPPQRPAVVQPQRDNSNAAPQQQPRNNGNYNQQQQPRNNGNAATQQQPQNNGNNTQQQQTRSNGNNNATQQQSPRNNGNYNPQQRNGNQNVGPQQRGSNVATQQQRGGSYAQPRQTYGQQRGGYNQQRTTVYRSYPGLPYGKNRITVRPEGLYYNYRDYYRSYYTPRLGFSIGVLPYGYYGFYFGPRQYFYSEGLFYQYDNSQYTVVEPPIGAAVNTLPNKAESIVINGQQYYELNGVYYKLITRDDGSIIYEVAGKDGELNTDPNVQQEPPQIGDIADALPENYKTIKLSGQKYYVTDDGYYFQDAVDINGNKVYKVVGVPEEQTN